MGDSVIPVIFGGFFTILGVIIGWGLNEVSAIRRAKPKLCFKLNSTPDSELVEAELRTKTSASEYSIDIYSLPFAHIEDSGRNGLHGAASFL